MTPATSASLFTFKEVGEVQQVRRVIARVKGLPSCLYGQYVVFESGIPGLVIGFSEEEVLVLILGESRQIRAGETVTAKREPIYYPVGQSLIGRVVSALGRPIDGGPPIEISDSYPIFKAALGVMDRVPISDQLQTGIKIIDAMIPIGKGQRELILGDRMSGKTTLGTDAILNQKGTGVICVYCLIGRVQSFLKKTVELFERYRAFDYTVFLAETADASPGEQYLAPYSTATIAEYFAAQGKDVLVIFDDLTKHAWVYRQISLLMERAPGREAYPGDMFFVHSQLMERAGRFVKEHGGGSITYLPIVETQQGDITGHIPSNLVSMTDGQIYLSSSLFNEGFKPAVEVGLSVTRIGNKVQPPGLKEVAKTLRFEYTQHTELVKLTRLRSSVSDEIQARLWRGHVLREILTQPKNTPFTTEAQVLLFYAFQKKVLERLTLEGVRMFQEKLMDFFTRKKIVVLNRLREEKELSPTLKLEIDRALEDFIEKEGLPKKDENKN